MSRKNHFTQNGRLEETNDLKIIDKIHFGFIVISFMLFLLIMEFALPAGTENLEKGPVKRIAFGALTSIQSVVSTENAYQYQITSKPGKVLVEVNSPSEFEIAKE